MPFDSASSLEQAKEIAFDAVTQAKKLGVTQAQAEVSFDSGLTVGVRDLKAEIVERAEEKVLTLSVWIGKKKACVSSSDFSSETIKALAKNAEIIARNSFSDEAFGLPDEDAMQTSFVDLDIYHPYSDSIDKALNYLCEVEEAAYSYSNKIVGSDGIRFSTSQGVFALADSRNFLAGYPYARHDLDCALVAESQDEMQTDFSFIETRKYECLGSPRDFGEYSAKRTISKLGSRVVKTQRVNVLFDARVAVGLLDILEELLSGRALYRNLTCLKDSFGKQIFPKHITIEENPYLPCAIGSGAFDDEGCRGYQRNIVDSGVLEGAFLTSYSARKLGLKTTGNAGGAYNLIMTSDNTSKGDDLKEMLSKLGRGLYVTELIGHGFNPVNGEYSRGAFGFWVESGEIAFPVSGVTISGNILEMMRNLEYIGSDVVSVGGRYTGSHIVSNLMLACL